MPRKAKTPPVPAPLRSPHRPAPPKQGQRAVQRPMPPRPAPQRHQGR